MSQERLARFALTSTKTIARIEHNRTAPRAATLTRIAVALGVEPGFFALWTQDRPHHSILAARRRKAKAEAVSA